MLQLSLYLTYAYHISNSGVNVAFSFMQTLFFVQLTSSETRKVLEHIINYVLYKVSALSISLSVCACAPLFS